MKTYTDITVILDRSGSMASIKPAMEGAFAEFIQQHRSVPSTRLTLVQFDSVKPFEIVYEAKPITEAQPLTLHPGSMTPLLDAVCRTIDHVGARLGGMSEAERPDQVLFVIITDGHENASTEFTKAQVRERVTHQQAAYQWQFVFLGANQDAFGEAAQFGMPIAAAMNYSPTMAAVQGAGRSLGAATLRYATRQSADVSYTGEERKASLSEDELHKVAPK